MSKKYLLLSIAAFATILSTSSCHASASSSTSAQIITSEFEFAHQVFGRYAASNLDEEMPSLAQLYQDAVERKKHIDTLFSFANTHGMKEPTKELTKGLVGFFQDMRGAGGFTQKVSDDLMLMSIFKGDFAVERDMMTYYVKALERLAANPTQEHIEELYAQTVYTTRLNLQSLTERMFIDLHLKFPRAFRHERRDGVVSKAIFMDELNKVMGQMSLTDLACATFCAEMGKNNSELHERDTPEITTQTRGLLALNNLNADGIIFDLNSLSFYLNVERALLAACASLQFEPEKYGFKKKIETHKDRFVLSGLLAHHKKGLLSDAVERQYKDTELALIKRNKDKLLKSILSDTANGVLATMLSRLGVGPAKAAAASPSKPTTRGPARRKHIAKKPKLAPTPIQDESSVLAPPLSPLLFEREDIDVDTRPEEVGSAQESALAQGAYTDQDADLAQAAEADQGAEVDQGADVGTTPQETESSSSSAPRITRLIPDLSSYTYKRNTAWTPEINIASYVFDGTKFQMPGTFFDLEQLRIIKELTHHKPGQEQLPNLASSHLRFHYEVDGISRTLDFRGRALYLSGGNRFRDDEPYRTRARIQNAFHNVLSAPERRAFLQDVGEAKWKRLTHKTTQILNSSVATGPWGVNCADSEGILLVDLARQLPHYLADLAARENAPLHIQGAVLGVSTYRDPCWRCRNLLQGWQWGLENALSVAVQERGLPITMEKELPTLVYGFGEIKPDSRDFFPPRMSQEETVLSTAGATDSPGATHKLRLVTMQR